MSTGFHQFGGQSCWIAAEIRTLALSKRRTATCRLSGFSFALPLAVYQDLFVLRHAGHVHIRLWRGALGK